MMRLMTTTLRRATFLCLAVLCLLSATGIVAANQAPAQTPSQFYLAYRVAFDKATSIDQIKPFHSKAMRAEMDATPAAERGMMFQMLKMIGTVTNVKIVKETKTATSASLSVEGIDADKAKTTGEITLVLEDGAWKIGKEDWKAGAR
jgi:hypothetical protein